MRVKGIKKKNRILSYQGLKLSGIVRYITVTLLHSLLGGCHHALYTLKECVFVNSALKLQYYIVKNTLLQTAFWAILPTG